MFASCLKLPGWIFAATIVAHTATAADLRWANEGDIAAMDPASRQESLQSSFLSNIYEPLIRRNRDLRLEPALAERWEQTSPTIWRFHLRQGVHWQDGSPFTADDVVFSVRRYLSPTSSLRAPIAAVKEARKVDDHTVDIETIQPDLILPQEQTNLLIMSQPWCEAHGAVSPATIGHDDNYALRHAMGTGPFRLVSREPDRSTVLERNALWWDRPEHNLQRVELVVIGNAATRVAALLSGDVDMIHAVPPQDMPRIKATPGLKLLEHPELRTIFLGFNIARAELPDSDVRGRNPLRDQRVRLAIALTIDEVAIASRIMRGLAHPTWSLWGPGINGYDPAQDVRPKPDPARAKLLLAEAGYPNGFRLGLDCPNDRYTMDEQICTAIVPMLARVGIKVSLTTQTKSRYFGKILAPGNESSVWMLGWTPASYDALNALYTLLGTPNGQRGEVNLGGYSNPALDRLIAEIGREAVPARRMALIQEANAIVQQDVPVLPLHQQAIVWATKENVDAAQPADNFFPYRLVRMR